MTECDGPVYVSPSVKRATANQPIDRLRGHDEHSQRYRFGDDIDHFGGTNSAAFVAVDDLQRGVAGE